ncbi:outer membrane protein assembly factor BamD [Rhodospirillum rubrum]|uniref:Outer membrane protein assembly factor BamD n=1 Tax=Rhodospirillum rubrum (strain ATCC 11170 / ATH 1.1.1 / DSM 467 / LMG 4362 / NCIMB 8255 / S1) TaxID=269796 RepID=Q2RVV3_RHORT|nr:outer membrane protein assembly factor BamD [Rhodospirillum rubrum]ABC21742.1 competence lipoprotein ComL, putative [Rhodospirillum rubrum ATCC 11170]AEO47440.1 competence lipoprotein ComL [Rhodospirillum rubrum F11]MBK5953298.1 outer membrane protein assembly factor BamD [Rhodospirillum rubrum]QXG81404.1 outer membrane protein assembly factor BamD [Rhodospirillum rubrum]HAQ00325.1 outer membrane protein assembly factor BamD [Rhodospirillum rubrum]
MTAERPIPFRRAPARSSSFRALAAAFLIGGALALSACSSKKDEPEYVERPVEELYNEAVDLLNTSSYALAAKAFDEVERQHPYSSWATKAQIMSAYALYENEAYDDAVVAINRFIELHPGNRDIAYAYYLRGLCYYEQISDVRRDQQITRQAMSNLRDVVTRFPDSPYARDARLKIDLARDHIAGKEMSVGRFYLKRQDFLAALNRFRVVVEQYDQTTHVPEALYRMVEINTLLGLPDEAKRVAAVLGHNFPGSDWYGDAYRLITGEKVPSATEGAEPPPSSSWTDSLTGWL